VHHALINVLEPIYERRFSGSSYACRVGKGTHAAIERAHWGIRNCRWFLKGDIAKFYPSVDHGVLKKVLFQKVADSNVQWLISLILESGKDVLADESPPQWFAGDELLTPLSRARGLPIGNLTSQFFANVLLNELDQCVHHEIRPREYVRYADDFILFGNDLEQIQGALPTIRAKLAALRLKCHEHKTCVRPCGQGVRFLGFRLLPWTRRVDKGAIGRFRRRMRRFAKLHRQGRMDFRRVTQSVQSWLAHVRFANTKCITSRVLNDVCF
ncbi:MAG: reverse transcriptase/maturase family protein, partial [Verrucomicrobiae bacterium]|nr:reverse transcriptase/maturase family protein [Verrucomicrobiae bacterium]